MLFDDITKQPVKKMDSYNSYKIAKKTYDFGMTYVRNRTINMTLVMLFLVGNKKQFVQYKKYCVSL